MGKKAQLKIQEMAFVLLGIMMFFGMVALVYFSIRLSSLEQDVGSQREEEAMTLARKIADIPEFSWGDCAGCVDADKALAVKYGPSYNKFWNLDYLSFEFAYPERRDVECTKANYPDCSRITIINKSIGTPASSFVALCWLSGEKGVYEKCEIGKVYATAKEIGT